MVKRTISSICLITGLAIACFPSAVKQKYWAPSKAVAANGKHYIYPTVNGFMYPAVAGSPDGPFKIAVGRDTLYTPYTPATLLKTKDGKPPYGIDAEIFIDDDGQAYAYWQWRHAAKLQADMVTVDTNVVTINTAYCLYRRAYLFQTQGYLLLPLHDWRLRKLSICLCYGQAITTRAV